MCHSYFQTRFLHIICALCFFLFCSTFVGMLESTSSIILVSQNILLNQIKFQILQCKVLMNDRVLVKVYILFIYLFIYLVYFIMLLAIVESITICNLLVHWYLLAFLYKTKTCWILKLSCFQTTMHKSK
jgi:hypothetical protein